MNIQQSDFESFLFQFFQGMQHSMMFESGRDDMHLSLLFAQPCSGEDRLVVSFASAGGEDDFTRGSANDGGDVFPCLFQCFFGSLSDTVQTGGIAPCLLHETYHGRNGRIAHFCCSGIIRIDHNYLLL